MVRQLLAAEVGQRAAEGHIGPANRWFAGTRYIDEIEALCVELLKRVFAARYADHRLVASMIGNMTVYAALTQPGDAIMSVTQPFGGHSSNRGDGPAACGLADPRRADGSGRADRRSGGVRGAARAAAGAHLARASMTLFPFPVVEMAQIAGVGRENLLRRGASARIDRWRPVSGSPAGGRRRAHRIGRENVLGAAERRDHLDDPALTVPLTDAIFPTLAATHQVNRVAAAAAAAAGIPGLRPGVHGPDRGQCPGPGRGLGERGVPMLAAHKGYTRTHQAIADVRGFGGGEAVAFRLAEANIITNKNLIPSDRAQDGIAPAGCVSTTEVTRWGMKEPEMARIADLMADVLHGRCAPVPCSGMLSPCAAPSRRCTIASLGWRRLMLPHG